MHERLAHPAPHRTSRRGFTLVEALLATTILSVVALSALLPFAAGLQNTQEAVKFEQAVELAEAMMEEVLARPFFAPTSRAPSPGPESGETSRALFNAVDDFHDFCEFNELSQKSEPADFRDQKMSDTTVEAYHREVSVDYVSFPDQSVADTDSFMHVQVRVYHNQALLVTLDRLIARED